jgi:hypothetical protein
MAGEQLDRLADLGGCRFAEQVGVHPPCDLWRGMPENQLHDFDGHASGEHERASAVTRVVQRHNRKPAGSGVALGLNGHPVRPQL